MGKLYNNLQKQLETEYKKEAEDCIKVYNKLKEISGGCVWHSDWSSLVHTIFIGTCSDTKPIYKLKALGKVFLKGITYDEITL